MRKLATIRRVSDITFITGATSVCQYMVDGWPVVDSIGKYSIGDAVIFCEPDSWLPETVAPFLYKGKSFNGVPGSRLRTIKLRGVLSQGLVLPISVLFATDDPYAIGTDVTEQLGIQKWDKPLPSQLTGQAKGYFPEFLRKTDQERAQNLTREIKDSFDRGDVYEVTIKLDGSSMTTYYKDGDVGVCSRNLELKLNEENASNTFINTAVKTGLLDALKAYGRNIAVQGELMGEGIQGNRESLAEHQIFVFDIFDIDTREYMTPYERSLVYGDLQQLGFSGQHVPVFDIAQLISGNVSELLAFAEGPSLHNPVREGLVYKRTDGKFSFKTISNQFLLKEKD